MKYRINESHYNMLYESISGEVEVRTIAKKHNMDLGEVLETLAKALHYERENINKQGELAKDNVDDIEELAYQRAKYNLLRDKSYYNNVDEYRLKVGYYRAI